jgi:hypothetical protein
LAQKAGKIGQKERKAFQGTEALVETDNLSNLSDLSSGFESKPNGRDCEMPDLPPFLRRNPPALGPPGDSLDDFK